MMALSRICRKFFTVKTLWNANCVRYYCYHCKMPACLSNRGVVCISNHTFDSKLGQWSGLCAQCQLNLSAFTKISLINPRYETAHEGHFLYNEVLLSNINNNYFRL